LSVFFTGGLPRPRFSGDLLLLVDLTLAALLAGRAAGGLWLAFFGGRPRLRGGGEGNAGGRPLPLFSGDLLVDLPLATLLAEADRCFFLVESDGGLWLALFGGRPRLRGGGGDGGGGGGSV
jgi:hypothetical protein